MNIDDPQEAVAAQIQGEERADSVAKRYIPALAKALGALPAGLLPPPLKVLAQGAAWFIEREREQRRAAFAEVLASELSWVKGKLLQVVNDHARFMRDDFPKLVLDALEKAEQTRSGTRIARMGTIVANAALSGASRPPDTTEELTRISMALDDSDVSVLAELVRGQRIALDPGLGTVPGELVNNYWRTGEEATHEIGATPRSTIHGRLSGVAIRLDIPEGELHARCAKLQAYGLVVQVERNQNKLGPGTVPYAVLTRGIEFIDAIRSLCPE